MATLRCIIAQEWGRSNTKKHYGDVSGRAIAEVVIAARFGLERIVNEHRAALLEETVAFWQPRSSRRLTGEDARQAVENVTGFFATLQRWAAPVEPSDRKEKEAA